MNEILHYCRKEHRSLGQIYSACHVAYPELKKLTKGLVVSEFLDPVKEDGSPAFKGKHLYEFRPTDEPKPNLHKFNASQYHYYTTILGRRILDYQSNIARLDKAANEFNEKALLRAGVPSEETEDLLNPNNFIVMRVPQADGRTVDGH